MMTMSDIIFRITSSSPYELAVEMYDQEDYRAEARYSAFSLGDAASNYTVGNIEWRSRLTGGVMGACGESFHSLCCLCHSFLY